MKEIFLPAVTSIGNNAFKSCSALTKLVLGNTEQVATLGTAAFYEADKAIVYVPDELVDAYKSATNWSAYADRIKGIREIPEE